MKATRLEVCGRPCRNCGTPVVDPPGAGRGQWRRYCTDDCRDEAQSHRTGDVIRSLRSGDPIPTGPARRYTSGEGYVRLRWRVGPRLLLETYEHRVRDGVIVDDEHVHHLNHQPADNRPENLKGMTAREHADLHANDKRAPWERIARMYEAGLTQPQIADELGVNSSTVSRALSKVGVKARPTRSRFPIPPERKVRAAYGESTSAVDLARRLDIAVHTARVAMQTYGLTPFRAGRPSQR